MIQDLPLVGGLVEAALCVQQRHRRLEVGECGIRDANPRERPALALGEDQAGKAHLWLQHQLYQLLLRLLLQRHCLPRQPYQLRQSGPQR